ncbi:MAG: hypothetical protein NC099_00975 [Corallococcus sp.]|nr:hypothetical protein [Corallococcus sp.]
MQKRGEWSPRQKKIAETIPTVKGLPCGSHKLIFQVYYLEKGDCAKPFNDAMKEHIDGKLNEFVKKLRETLIEINNLQ